MADQISSFSGFFVPFACVPVPGEIDVVDWLCVGMTDGDNVVVLLLVVNGTVIASKK